MLSGKKVSLKNVISKVYSDLGINDEDSYIKIIEWLGEAIGKIKVHEQLESVEAKLNICNFKAELPCDLLYLEEVNYQGRQLIKSSSNTQNLHREGCMTQYNQYFSVDLNKINNKAFELGSRGRATNDLNFKIENGWFKSSFESGDIDIVYKRFPVDEEGFPLIPEEESFREALFWYVAFKYFYLKKIESDGSSFNKYSNLSSEAKQNWHWYCGQAGSEAMMPDVFTLENIKRNFISLVPKINSFDTFFTNLNK